MKTEFEATFNIISKDDIRRKLKSTGATLVKNEYLQKRVVFNLPEGHEIQNGWLRVRDESDSITMSLKVVQNNSSIENQKEIELKIDSFDSAVEFLSSVGCERKAYQENKREKWTLDNVEIVIDEWPFIEPYVEIEGQSEEAVKNVARKLGFDYSLAYFGSVDGLYAKKYGISEDRINNNTPEITFGITNPFID